MSLALVIVGLIALYPLYKAVQFIRGMNDLSRILGWRNPNKVHR